MGHLVIALLIAWGGTFVILLQSSLFCVCWGEGVNALERLMGLILVMMATQMFLDGVRMWMKGDRFEAGEHGISENDSVHVMFIASLRSVTGERVKGATQPLNNPGSPAGKLFVVPSTYSSGLPGRARGNVPVKRALSQHPC